MNFILTYSCNKGCPYCFASKVRKENLKSSEMSIGLFKKLLNKTNSQVKLLGGEPTQHTQFKEIVQELIDRRRQFTLISNFLFDENILEIILNAMKYIKVSFLVNATDLDKLNRMETFKKNYNTIYGVLYKIDKEEEITIGLTLEESKDYIYYLKYIDFLISHIKKVETVRLSLDFSEKTDEKRFSFINNEEYGEKLFIITKRIVDMGSLISIDCNIYPCIFSNKEEYKYINNFSGREVRFICNGVPSDIFPDETISYCYPLKKISIDTRDYDDLDDIPIALKMKYNILMNKQKLPKECEECSFYAQEVCNGPSLCSFDSSKF